ncbi:prickle-like protein 4 isoform X6 [Heterocephalus glaber]|uniref:Prickle-like protein 4 isoform X6 n=1 Tax=Heterocephalus glaber TaxID=10181 RepID=A0AAX6T0Z1_HETGA|nr:prickle-like protein 4 isoform X6 [Heterocephalus glaber]
MEPGGSETTSRPGRQGPRCQRKWLLLALRVNTPSWPPSTGNLSWGTEREGSRSATAWPLGKRSWPNCGSSVPSGSRRPWDRGWPTWYLLSLKDTPVRRQQLKPGEVGVFAAPEGEQRCWHWPCFACQACGQVLMHLIYFYHDGRLYCGRHHAELLRPRCPACDQLIFSRRCTEAEGRRWHENHFCCLDCAGPLAGGSYTLPGGSPCCPSCFESRYPDTAGAPEGQALPGKGAEGAGHSGRGGDRFMGAAGSDRSRGSARAPESDVAQVPRSSPDTPRGRGGPDATQEPEESAPCPTCSSSSESEPEGFFLGRRLPGPRKIPGDGDASGKRCSVC